MEYYKDIARWIEEGKVISVTSALEPAEFDAHYSDEHNTLLKEQSKRIEFNKEFTQYLSSASSKNKINNSVDRLHIENRLECLSNKLCHHTTIIRQEDKYARMADYRTRMAYRHLIKSDCRTINKSTLSGESGAPNADVTIQNNVFLIFKLLNIYNGSN